jgi:hypothetical protein
MLTPVARSGTIKFLASEAAATFVQRYQQFAWRSGEASGPVNSPIFVVKRLRMRGFQGPYAGEGSACNGDFLLISPQANLFPPANAYDPGAFEIANVAPHYCVR